MFQRIATLFVACLALAAVEEKKEVYVRVQTSDGSSFSGVARLPAIIAIKTNFGEMRIEADKIGNLTRGQDGKWRVSTAQGDQFTGECALGGIEIDTGSGKLTVNDSDLRTLTVVNQPGRPPVASTPSLPQQRVETAKPLFEGVEYRKTPENFVNRIPYAPAILLSSGKHIALLDHTQDECVFYDVASDAVTRVKVESKPVCLVEKNDKIYVANSGGNSLTIIDGKTLAARGRLALGVSPRWVAAPQRGDVLYFITGETTSGVHVIDTKTDKLLGPLRPKTGEGTITGGYLHFISVSPDNRYLVTQTGTGSPLCRPDVYFLDGGRFTGLPDIRADRHKDHPGPFVGDATTGRMYCGYHVYTTDLRRRIGQPPCAIVVPHPSFKLLCGVKSGERIFSVSATLAILDEEKLTVLKEIPVGATMYNLVPTDNIVYGIGSTHIYKIPIEKILGGELASYTKEARPRIDLTREIDAEKQKKAHELIVEGEADLDEKRFADARKKFTEADAADPFSNAKIGHGMALVREEKFSEAVEYFQQILTFPFREANAWTLMYNQQGIAYGRMKQADKAIESFTQGLQLRNNDPQILKNLGVTYANDGKIVSAYISWVKALKSDPKQADTIKMLNEIKARIKESTAGTCTSCKGDGKFEVIIEERSGAQKKMIEICRTCKGAKRTWKLPCVDCNATGQKDYYTRCDKCYGDGTIEESMKEEKPTTEGF